MSVITTLQCAETIAAEAARTPVIVQLFMLSSESAGGGENKVTDEVYIPSSLGL